MKRVYVLYVLVLVLILLPIIPMSLKGVLGLVFIIFNSAQFGFKRGLQIAVLLIILETTYLILDINVDYKYGVFSMIIGSLVYLIFAFFIGKITAELKNKNDELVGEIERRKKSEIELNQKVALLQGLMDTIPVSIYFKDLDFRYTGCNISLEQNFGLSEELLLGKNIYDLFDKETADLHDKMDRDLVNNNARQTYETTAIFADGSERNIIYNKSLFTDGEGIPVGIVGVMTDITEQKRNLDLKKSIEEELRIINIKTELFTNISHELRTPLNVILGAVQLLEIYLQESQITASRNNVIRNVESMKKNCLRLLRLVNNLIDINRIDSNAYKIQIRNCNIVNIVEEITLSIAGYVNNKGIKLEFDTDTEEKIIACDDEIIERIMLNLLSNATKFTQKGGNIFVKISSGDNSVNITVRDTGKGIPKDKYNEVFQRFSQISPLFTREHEGSGIGLSLVKTLVEMHGGEVSFESELGKGTSFKISLPNRMLREDELRREEPIVRQNRVERIELEFAELYSEAT